MAKHTKTTRRSKKLATLGVATATATALTVGAAPPEAETSALRNADVDLLAGIQYYPEPEHIPDLTFGLGAVGYGLSQDFAEMVIRGLVDNISFAALAEALGLDLPLGLDLQSQLENVLNNALAMLLGPVFGTLGQIPLDLDLVGLVGGLLDQKITAELADTLGTVLQGLEDLPFLGSILGDILDLILGGNGNDGLVDMVLGELLGDIIGGILPGAELDLDSLGGLLGLLRLDLSQPLNLSNLNLGLNLVTTGPLFTALKLFGADLGWEPALPNAVAREINETEYLNVGLLSLLNTLGLDDLSAALGDLPIVGDLPDLIALRVPIVIGVGLGAFAAGAAYNQVVADLANQPGGVNGAESLLGSYTILPMILLRNPGRANGGLFARMYPLAGLFGIDTVTPETSAQSSGGTVPVLGTGLTVGGANLIPVKIDATAEYDFLSDFAAWPNPFSMANNVAALLFPTYLLRGLSVLGTTESMLEQLDPQLEKILGDVLGGEALAINLYLTLPMDTLPLLEPLYLATDFINLFTPGFDVNNPIATALNPVLTSLVNLGYTDVYWDDAKGQYDRTLLEADIPTGFGTLPADVNWLEVPGNLFASLVRGVQDAFEEGLIGPEGSNVLRTLLGLIGLDLGGLGAGAAGLSMDGLPELLRDAVEDAVGGLGELGGVSPLSSSQPEAAAVPDLGADTLTLKTGQRAAALNEPDGAGLKENSEQPQDAAGEKTVIDTSTGDESPQPTPDAPREDAIKPPSSKLRTGSNGRGEVRTGLGAPGKHLQQSTERLGQRLQDRADKINDGLRNAGAGLRNGLTAGPSSKSQPKSQPKTPAKAGAGVGATSDSESGGDE